MRLFFLLLFVNSSITLFSQDSLYTHDPLMIQECKVTSNSLNGLLNYLYDDGYFYKSLDQERMFGNNSNIKRLLCLDFKKQKDGVFLIESLFFVWDDEVYFTDTDFGVTFIHEIPVFLSGDIEDKIAIKTNRNHRFIVNPTRNCFFDLKRFELYTDDDIIYQLDGLLK